MDKYWKCVKDIVLSRTRRKMGRATATADDIVRYRSPAGTLLYLCNGVLPQASLVVSLMHQSLLSLRVSHLIEANDMVRDLRRLDTVIYFPKVQEAHNVIICTLSDAAHPKERDYGQTG